MALTAVVQLVDELAAQASEKRHQVLPTDTAFPVLFHDGKPPFTSSLQIGSLAERYPGCAMILGHGNLEDFAVTRVATRTCILQTCATTLISHTPPASSTVWEDSLLRPAARPDP